MEGGQIAACLIQIKFGRVPVRFSCDTHDNETLCGLAMDGVSNAKSSSSISRGRGDRNDVYGVSAARQCHDLRRAGGHGDRGTAQRPDREGAQRVPALPGASPRPMVLAHALPLGARPLLLWPTWSMAPPLLPARSLVLPLRGLRCASPPSRGRWSVRIRRRYRASRRRRHARF